MQVNILFKVISRYLLTSSEISSFQSDLLWSSLFIYNEETYYNDDNDDKKEKKYKPFCHMHWLVQWLGTASAGAGASAGSAVVHRCIRAAA